MPDVRHAPLEHGDLPGAGREDQGEAAGAGSEAQEGISSEEPARSMRLTSRGRVLVGGQFRKMAEVRILLDGVEQDGVVSFDRENGFVERLLVDDRGKVVVDRRNGDLAIELVRGVVTVEAR